MANAVTTRLVRDSNWDVVDEVDTEQVVDDHIDPSHLERFQKVPQSFIHRKIFNPIIRGVLYGPSFFIFQTLTNLQRISWIGRSIMQDLGGESIKIDTGSGVIDGFFFCPRAYQAHKEEAFIKWLAFFKQPENRKFWSTFDINIHATNIRELFSLPSNVTHTEPLPVKGVVVCLGASTIYETSPQNACMYLERGLNLTLFNYCGNSQSTGIPCPERTSRDAVLVTRYMKERLDCEYREMVVVGGSMGSAMACFAATVHQGLHVIVDRGFSTMSSVTENFYRLGFLGVPSFMEQYYPLEVMGHLANIHGRITFITARHDFMMLGEAEKNFERLTQLFRNHVTQEHFNEYVVRAPGAHFCNLPGLPCSNWKEDAITQMRLTEALANSHIPQPHRPPRLREIA
ncbi:MAG: hypothetical protein S4CHLAM102_00120 [Chlamydiia bacterium]|nr:hypothetical protein [Chlamydiia bacterium]